MKPEPITTEKKKKNEGNKGVHVDRNCQVSHCFYCICEHHIRSPHPLTLPPSFQKWWGGRHVLKQRECVPEREHCEALPAWLWPQQLIYSIFLNTTSSLNLLSFGLTFSTWQVTFKLVFFERAFRGHYQPVSKLLSGPELVWEQRASHIELYLLYSHTWKPSSIWTVPLRAPYWKVSLTKVSILQDPIRIKAQWKFIMSTTNIYRARTICQALC